MSRPPFQDGRSVGSQPVSTAPGVIELTRVLGELQRVVVELEDSLAEMALAYDAGSRQGAMSAIANARGR